MNKKDIKLAKEKIIKCLTEDFKYGEGQSKINQALFGKDDGWLIFTGVNLEMVMDKVVLGLYFAMADSEGGSSD